MASANQIAVLTVPSPHSWIAINTLVERFGPVDVIAEQRQGKWDLVRRRIRRQGLMTVIGQIGFVMLQRRIERRSQERIAAITRDHGLQTAANPSCPVYEVGSVNSLACRAAIAMLAPKVMIVIGTRIIGKATLAAIRCPVINYHAGWNPAYRGQAGGYWALASGDKEHAGVTVHLVDEGVDTGDILYRTRFEAGASDNFSTYYYLQAAAARSLLLQAVEDALSGQLKPWRGEGPSKEHHHPTLWRYVRTGLTRGVW